MDADPPSTVVVPRWTPSPSPTRSLLKVKPKKSSGTVDLELEIMQTNHMQGTESEQAANNKSFPFSTGFGASETGPSLRYFGDYNNKNSSDHDHDYEHVLLEKPVLLEKEILDQDHICLTWKELGVSVSDGENGHRMILQDLTGYAQPGEVLAIMGPSGSGKSTLLDALGGRLSSKTKQTGEILINGRKETLAYGTSAYVTQDDTLMTTLTVREAVYYSAQLQLPDSMSRSEKIERAETTIREMGLQGSMDTRIGGWRVKGLSGGLKRRSR